MRYQVRRRGERVAGTGRVVGLSALTDETGTLEDSELRIHAEVLRTATPISPAKTMMQMVVPDSFQHGTSEQRVRWFYTGLEKGDIQACDTFGGAI